MAISCISLYSYIKPQLTSAGEINNGGLYIFIFLHQTTTSYHAVRPKLCCISLYSYIKPQLFCCIVQFFLVVYLYIPTSNHNTIFKECEAAEVVYLYIPTSNHNCFHPLFGKSQLYIFIFLHQTTTACIRMLIPICCISLYSYIKPQLIS